MKLIGVGAGSLMTGLAAGVGAAVGAGWADILLTSVVAGMVVGFAAWSVASHRC